MLSLTEADSRKDMSSSFKPASEQLARMTVRQ